MSQVIDLGFKPRAWQAECFRALRRFSVIIVHRRGGKTVLAIMRLVDAALRCQRELPRFRYIAPQLKQAKAIAWDLLKARARLIPGVEINESETWVQFPHNGARIRIFGADNPDSLRGQYSDGDVLDETAQMDPTLWSEVILPSLLDREGWALVIGTPKGVNLLSEIYFKALKDKTWFAALYTVADTDALTEEQVAIARVTMPESVFRQEMLCDFTASAANALITIDLATAARGRHLREDQYSFAPRVLGVDVARQGSDDSVIFRRQGLASWVPKIIHGADSQTVADAVVAEIIEWDPDGILVDGTGGYGAGVIDALRRRGYDVIEVQFGSKAMDARFQNKRVEMYWKTAEWLRSGGAMPDDPRLSTELCAPTYSHDNARGVMTLESKDDIKERLGFSPDRADALALTFAYEVAPKPRGLLAQFTQPATAVRDHDPFG